MTYMTIHFCVRMVALIELPALSGFLSQLRAYDEGARLKRDAMSEVVQVLNHLGMSRRAFVRRAQRLGLAMPSVTSLGNWISCQHIPSPENVDLLIDALNLILREAGESGKPWQGALRESSLAHNHALATFRRDAQNLERAKAMCDATIAWLNLADFPPVSGPWVGAFIPITREHGIQCLDILRCTHLDAAEQTTGPRVVEHELLAAKASIELAHQLNITGRYAHALEAADDGSYLLSEILDKYPGWRETLVDGYMQSVGERVTLHDFSNLALLRKARALHSLGQQTQLRAERNNLREMVLRTLHQATALGRALPGDSLLKPVAWHIWAGFALDTAENMTDLQQAAQHADCAATYAQATENPSRANYVQRYVTTMLAVEAAARMGKLTEADALLTAADEIEHYLTNEARLALGPGHRVVALRAVAAFWLTHAQREPAQSPRWREYCRRWQDAVSTGLRCAREAGMYDQEQRLLAQVGKVAPAYRALLSKPER